MKKMLMLALIGLSGLMTQMQSAQAAYLCEGMKAGETTDISGTVVTQANGKIFVKKGDNWLVQIEGFSEGVKMSSFVALREGLYAKLKSCRHGDTSKVSIRVKCNARGEPTGLQVVC